MNSKTIGNITEAIILSEFIKYNITVLQPFGDNERYDLVIEVNSKFYRIQCKTAKLNENKGTIKLPCCSSAYHRGGKKQDYFNSIDYFAYYCPQNNKCYILPIEEASSSDSFLRITEPLNNQKKSIRYEKNYLFENQIKSILNKDNKSEK